MNGGRVGVVGLTVAVAFAVGSALMLFGRQPVPGVDAQPSPASGVSAWVGTYRNRAGDGGAAAIGSAVDAGIESMGPLVERIARRRILASNPPFQTLRIELDANELTVEFVGARRYRAPLGGAAATHRGPDGTEVRVSFRLRNGRLVERIEADEGFSTNTYTLSDDARQLSLRSTMESDRLPAPITYTLRFRRES
ncbi:MAG: hypothetical protein KC593_12030 [Myxococcales bacterium]|nr:hypothetical protein [Myxococcales bacterium]